MSAYQHVLFAADFSEGSEQVGQKAKAIADCTQARLSLIHVVEKANISAGYELMPVLPEMPDDALLTEAREGLDRLTARLELENVAKWIVIAVSTKEGILKAAEEHAADLIVVGSRGRHGLALLLGSTAKAVLHGAPCDVLAVRIHS